MTFTLYKMSAPGWELDFYTEEEARVRLLTHICDQCRAEDGITEDSPIGDMLGTACGCEFDIDNDSIVDDQSV